MLNLFRNLRSNKSDYKLINKTKHLVLGTDFEEEIKKFENQILFGCGCFWGAEKGFWRLPGVSYTAVGYAGGTKENPTYSEVCSGITNHTEVVQVIWNEKIIDISDLLKLFWECHDPTQGNRQGNDNGTQYRSAIYTFKKSDYIKAISSKEKYQKQLSAKGFDNITTEIREDISFNKAENYHQQYLAVSGNRPYCSAMPTKVILEEFDKSNFKINKEIWAEYNWEISHCILRGNNEQIKIN